MFKGSGFSESGEDLIATYLLGESSGTYIDVGSGHPVVGSNTYKFYRMGWTGVAIDANTSLKAAWTIIRPRDLFIPILIGEKSGEVEFYEYENDLRSTSNEDVKRFYDQENRKYKTTLIQQKTLDQIFHDYVDHKLPVFLSIDIEGSELEALKSLSFSKYKPTLIAVESWDLPWKNDIKTKELLESAGYVLVAYSGLTAFYMPSNHVEKLLETRPSIR